MRSETLLGGLHLFATNRPNVDAGRELTKVEINLVRCDDTRTARDGTVGPPACGTIDTDSNAASNDNSTMDGLDGLDGLAVARTLSSAFDSTTSKAQDESQKVSQFDSDAITP